MTTTTTDAGIRIDQAGHHRVTDDALARSLYTNPAVTARNALRPMEPLLEPARAAYAAVLASPAGEQAQRSLLATDGDLHARLAAPVEAALLRAYQDPTFMNGVVLRAHELAGEVGDRFDPVDLAPYLHRIPAQVAVDVLFGIPQSPEQVRVWARAQTDFIWRRRVPGETDAQVAAWQMEGLGAARALTTACLDTVAHHKDRSAAGRRIPDVTSALVDDPTLTDNEVMGLVYGVGIAAIEGNGYTVGNVIHGALTTGVWSDLAAAQGWRAAAHVVAPLLRARPGVHTAYRTADADIATPGGHVIPAGATIAFDLAAIGDPFGGIGNPHRCTGAAIGRVTAAVIPWVLASAYPHAALDEDQPPEVVDSRFFDGFRHLHVNLGQWSM